MSESTVTQFPNESEQPMSALTELIRRAAREAIQLAVEDELEAFLATFAEEKLPNGKARLVRHGHLPERDILTGIGKLSVKVPRVRDRDDTGKKKIKFVPSMLPRFLRKSDEMSEFLPWLHLKGISSGDMQDALAGITGCDASGMSAATIRRLASSWVAEFEEWQKRDLGDLRIVYIWADGVYFKARSEAEKQCVLVVMGADEQGRKHLLGLTDGYRESTESWRELLLDLKSRGLEIAPKLAVGDGAMGFWSALSEVYGTTKVQRCWFHKMANVLNAMPKKLQDEAKQLLQKIWQAKTREDATKAFDFFVETYGLKYEKAVDKLTKDRDELMAFYDFPTEHWKHIRTTNPIESTFATVRHRTKRSKNCLTRKTGLAMAFKLMQQAERRWKRLHGYQRIGELIEGVAFKNGVAILPKAA